MAERESPVFRTGSPQGVTAEELQYALQRHFGNLLDYLGIKVGTGVPNGSVTGSVGDIYRRTDGGALTSVYFKESGNDTNTGWVGK